MILALNPNTAIDYTLRVPSFELNTTIRAEDCAWGMGGKAADVAWILGKLRLAGLCDEPVTALGFAAGPNGVRMEAMLRKREVETDFVWVQGETRLNLVIVCPGSGQSTFTSPSLQVTPEQLSLLESKYRDHLKGARCVVIGGSLPPGVPPAFYERMISLARRDGLPVVFDASHPALAAGVKAHPSLIKPNREELAGLLGYQPVLREEIQHAILKLSKMYKLGVIVTLGEKGALASTSDQQFFIPALPVQVASAAGAGDGVIAGTALALAHGEPLENGLRMGFALAGAIVQTLTTADFEIEEYRRLLDRVEIQPLP